MLEDPYLKRRPPKSTGREYYGHAYVENLLALGRRFGASPSDLVRGATIFTALSVRDGLKRFVVQRTRIDELIVSGGGAHNPLIMTQLAAALAPITVFHPRLWESTWTPKRLTPLRCWPMRPGTGETRICLRQRAPSRGLCSARFPMHLCCRPTESEGTIGHKDDGVQTISGEIKAFPGQVCLRVLSPPGCLVGLTGCSGRQRKNLAK